MFKKITEFEDNDRELVGLKAFNCYKMITNGIECPEGFVIVDKITADDEKKVMACSKNELYAVRSSMVDEDGIYNSRAGQYLTELAVSSDELIESISRVLKSGKGNKHRCALVQKMICAEASGVMFTSDPVYNSKNMIIDSYIASGENIVAGIFTPDRFEVNSEGIVSKSISHKKGALLYGADTDIGRIHNLNGIITRTAIHSLECSLESVMIGQCNKASLSDEQVMQLYGYGRKLINIFGEDLDVEFSVYEGRIILLQVRPITSRANISKRGVQKTENRKQKI